MSVLGPVKASQADSFQAVVDAFRVCPTLGISHAAFLALDEKQRNEKKQVPFFVPACFKEAVSKRVYDQATHCNLIFLDIDPEKEQRDGKWVETGKYPAAPFVRNPDSLYTALQGFNFAAHLTASSTPEKPRMRIVVDADKIPLDLYPQAAMAVAALLGLPSITKESKVAVQPMFLPVMFSDTPDDEHPLIAYSFSGRAFTSRDVGDDLFTDYETKPAEHNGHNGSNGQSHGVDALEFLRAPVPEATLAVAKEALDTLDADCSRPEWLSYAASLKHQFTPHREEEAFELFDEWSKTGEKYGGQEETRALWKSLRPSPIGRVPITIRTLFKKAVDAGWDDKKLKKSCFDALLRWMEDVESEVALLEQGPRKILAMPLISAMQEDVLIGKLCASAKRRFSYSISQTSVKKDLKRIKAEIKSQEQAAGDKIKEPKWTKGVCYISASQEFYRHKTGEKYKLDAFNAIYGRHLLPTKEHLIEQGIPVSAETLSRPITPPSVYALNHIKIPTVYDYEYDPSQPTDVFFVNRGRKYVNVYSPTYPELDARRADQAGELLQRHLTVLIGEPEYRQTMIDFLAFTVQSPGIKIRWAPLLQSVEGAGKTFLAKLMSSVLGDEHVKVIDGGSIKSGWNEWCFGRQIVVLEEVRVAGTNRHEIMNALKPLITNDVISVNERFRNNRQVANISNYMLFSNHHDALALTPGDRRYFVVKSPLQSKQQVLALGEDYFTILFDFIKYHPGAMRAFLIDWEISPGFRCDGHAPRTKYVQNMVDDSASDLTAAVRRLMLEGDCPLIQFDIVSAKVLADALQLEEGLDKPSPQQLAHVLRDEGLSQVGRHQIGDDRHYLWCRAGVDESAVAPTAQDRHKRGLKNLCMELVF